MKAVAANATKILPIGFSETAREMLGHGLIVSEGGTQLNKLGQKCAVASASQADLLFCF